MSTISKLVLISSCILSGGIVAYVHLKQQIDREKLHEGVLRDIERQQMRKTENIYLLQRQKDLAKELQNQLNEKT